MDKFIKIKTSIPGTRLNSNSNSGKRHNGYGYKRRERLLDIQTLQTRSDFPFPKNKPFYEKIVHKKVPVDYYQAIPFGKKVYIWFTFYENAPVAIILERNRKTPKAVVEIEKAYIRPISFAKPLAFNTLVYGTLVSNTKESVFCLERLHQYKGKIMHSVPNYSKLECLEYMFKNEINQTGVGDPKELLVVLPLMNRSLKLLKDEITLLPYNIFAVNMFFFKDTPAYSMRWNVNGNSDVNGNANGNNDANGNGNSVVCGEDGSGPVGRSKKRHSNSQIFEVRADLQNDIYYLNSGGNEEELIAYIPNIAVSVFMNSIFRKIKENDNLDLLEESEDEEEFEDTNDERFVDLEKRVKIRCEYHKHFKRWVPLELIN
jgi:hypothetical protein